MMRENRDEIIVHRGYIQQKYSDGCDIYQRYKNRTKAPVGKLMPNVIPEKP